MAPTKDSQNLFHAQTELWHQTLSYVKSLALALAIDLGIADAIHHKGGAATLSEIIAKIGINQCKLPYLRRLMRVLTIAGTFDVQLSADDISSSHKQEAVYKLTTVSSFLVTGDDAESSISLSPFVRLVLGTFHDSPLGMGLAAWFRHEKLEPCPFALLNGTSMWEMAERDASFNALVNNAMAADSRFLMQVILKDCPEVFHGIDSLVDVAGGLGVSTSAIAAALPHVKCMVLDLPHVVANAPSGSNLQFVAGDMFQSIPPANAVFLKWILHDWGDDKCISILKNCKQAILPSCSGGKVIIIDMVVGYETVDTKHHETQALWDILVMEINGAERDELEWKRIFTEAGYRDYKIMPILGLRSIIELYP